MVKDNLLIDSEVLLDGPGPVCEEIDTASMTYKAFKDNNLSYKQTRERSYGASNTLIYL